MKKRIVAFTLACIVGITPVMLSSCDKYSKTPAGFTPPFDYNLPDYITLGQYKGIEYVKRDITATDEQIEAKIAEELADSSTTQVISDRPAQLGDTLTINYVGTIDGEQFEGGTATEQTLTLGSHSFIEGFEDGLVGANTGDTVALHLKFPDIYTKSPELAGKDVDFTVLIRYIRGIIVPELTDEFVATIGDYSTVDDYRQHIISEVQAANEETAKQRYSADVLQSLIDNSEIISVPEKEVKSIADNVLSQYTSYAESYSMTIEDFISQYVGTDYDTFYADVQKYANTYVEQKLVIYSVIKAEKMRLTDKEYDEGVAKLAESNDTTVEALEEQYEFSNFWESIMFDKVIAFLLDNAVAVEAETSDVTTSVNENEDVTTVGDTAA